jgi:hypothetical protein
MRCWICRLDWEINMHSLEHDHFKTIRRFHGNNEMDLREIGCM